MAYQLNDVPRFTGTFKNASAVLTDPTAVTFTYTTPAGVATTLTYGVDVAVVKSSTGVYYVDLALSATGRWSIVWRGTGTVADADETDIIVGVSDAYCTLAELKDELTIAVTDTGDDAKLQRSINAASRQIDGWCGWRFWQDATAIAREFYCDGGDCIYLLDADPGDGISTTTGLIVQADGDGDGTYETTLTVGSDFLLLPRGAASGYPVRPYTELRAGLANSSGYFPRSYSRPSIQITAKWGWPAVPDDINKACLVQAAQLYKAKDTAFDVAGSNDFGAIRVRSGMNRTAESLLVSYRKPAIG